MLELRVAEDPIVRLEMAKSDGVNLKAESGGGTNNYNQLKNKPEINGHVLEGNKTLAELGLTVDTTLNGASNNPVANSAVVGGLQTKQNTLEFDTTPTENSTNPVTSGGLYTSFAGALQTVGGWIDTVEGQIPGVTSQLLNNGADGTSYYVEADELASVATSGDYNDLQNTPNIPAAQVNSDWNADSGVAQILNKPTIPDAQVNADWNASSGVAEILNKPTIPAAPVNADWNANSGLAQILNKPTIPAAQVNADWNASSGVAEILNKPTIPAAQVNSDWNANSGVAQILNKPSIPTKTSDITNDSGYVNATQAANAAPVQSVNGQTGAVSLGASDVGALPNTTVIPTKTSDLTNDSGYLTLGTLPIWNGGVT